MIFPSERYKQWHEEQMWVLKGTPAIAGPVKITVDFWGKDQRAWDMSNSWESIGDLLVDAGVLVDDSWKYIADLHLRFLGVQKGQARCVIRLEEVAWLPGANLRTEGYSSD